MKLLPENMIVSVQDWTKLSGGRLKGISVDLRQTLSVDGNRPRKCSTGRLVR